MNYIPGRYNGIHLGSFVGQVAKTMIHYSGSLVPRPLPVFQCWTLVQRSTLINWEWPGRSTLKNWEWPGDEATIAAYTHCSNIISIAEPYCKSECVKQCLLQLRCTGHPEECTEPFYMTLYYHCTIWVDTGYLQIPKHPLEQTVGVKIPVVHLLVSWTWPRGFLQTDIKAEWVGVV